MVYEHHHGAPAPGRHLNAPSDSLLTSLHVSKEDEAAKIASLEQSATGPRVFVRRSWWERWARWVGYPLGDEATSSGDLEPPGPVETTGSDDGDRVAVTQSTLEQLVKWYTAKEPTPFSTPQLQLRFFKKRPSRLMTCRFAATAKISEVLNKAATEMLPIQHGRVYLFDPVSRRDFFLTDERTLAELGIADNAVFCLLSFNGLGRKSGKVGLLNIGNTCYMNSSLQCLLHTPELMHYFLTRSYLSDVRPQNPDGCEGQFAEQFYKLMKKVWDTETDYANPYCFWDILSKYYPLFAEKDQHDTAELAETVLDGLMEDCNLASIPKPYFPEIKEDASISDSDMAETCWAYHKGRSSSFITDHFHGQYRILTRCPECGFESRKFDSFTVLHLGLPPPRTRIIVFTLVTVSGDQLPQKYAVELQSNLLVRDLYQEAAKLIGIDGEEPWTQLCFVLNRPTLLIFLQLQNPIGRISDYDEVVLYSYQGSAYGPTSGGQKTCFVHQKLVHISHYGSYCYSFVANREEKQEFGYPLVLWLPEDDEFSVSRKRSVLQDILEHSLRPFKRVHMAALQESEEQKDEALYASNNDMSHQTGYECSDPGSTHAQPDSAHALSAQSDPGEPEDNTVPEDEQVEQEEIPDVVEDVQDDQNDLYSEECPTKSPMEVEMTPLASSHDIKAEPLLQEEDGVLDPDIGDLFSGEPAAFGLSHTEPDPYPMSHCTNITNAVFQASSSSSSPLRFGAHSPADAYKLTEQKYLVRADEARTIVVDWDSNADQFYNLQNLEQPLLHESAYGVEERRRKAAESVTIHDCLHHEFSPHPCVLDGDNLWKCGGCKELVNGVKCVRLWKTPDILLIGLKRFDYCEARERPIKLNQMVTFPLEKLDLTDYFAPVPNTKAVYDLYGVCHHHGHGPKVGHYTSCVKSPGGVWHKYNDSWCTEVPEHAVVNQDAYLLYYRKRDLPFPTEKEILDIFLAKERREFEDQAVQLYHSQVAECLQGISDDDATMTNGSSYTQFGKGTETYNNRTDNGSSSSNDMNNENEMMVLSSQGQGSSSSLYPTQAAIAETSQFRGSSSSAFDALQNCPNSFPGMHKEPVLALEWPTQNDVKAVAAWQNCGVLEETSGDVEDGFADSGEQGGSSLWHADHETGSVTMTEGSYDPSLFDSIQIGKK